MVTDEDIVGVRAYELPEGDWVSHKEVMHILNYASNTTLEYQLAKGIIAGCDRVRLMTDYKRGDWVFRHGAYIRARAVLGFITRLADTKKLEAGKNLRELGLNWSLEEAIPGNGIIRLTPEQSKEYTALCKKASKEGKPKPPITAVNPSRVKRFGSSEIVGTTMNHEPVIDDEEEDNTVTTADGTTINMNKMLTLEDLLQGVDLNDEDSVNKAMGQAKLLQSISKARRESLLLARAENTSLDVDVVGSTLTASATALKSTLLSSVPKMGAEVTATVLTIIGRNEPALVGKIAKIINKHNHEVTKIVRTAVEKALEECSSVLMNLAEEHECFDVDIGGSDEQ